MKCRKVRFSTSSSVALPPPSGPARLFPYPFVVVAVVVSSVREKRPPVGQWRDRGSREERPEAWSGLNWNCHVRESEANQKKNNLYRIEFNCDPSYRVRLPTPAFAPSPLLRLAASASPWLATTPSRWYSPPSSSQTRVGGGSNETDSDYRSRRGRLR